MFVRFIGIVLWASVLAAIGLALLAWLVPGELDGAGRAHLVAYWFAFMGRTYAFHLGLCLLAAAAVEMVIKRRKLAVLAAVAGAIMAGPGMWAQRPRGEEATAGVPLLRVMSCNLLVGHTQIEDVVAEIGRCKPDVIVFQEYSPRTAAALVRELAMTYPYRSEAMRDHAFGEAVFSKLPFVGEPDPYPHAAIRDGERSGGRDGGVVGIQDPQIRAVVSWEGREVVVQNVHTAPPIGRSMLAEQRRYVRWLAESVRGEKRAVIAAGDFNSTPESHNARDLRLAGMTEAHDAAGTGRGGTWPSGTLLGGPLAWLPRVRIDMVWSKGLRCVRSEVCGATASDHRPVVAEFTLENR